MAYDFDWNIINKARDEAKATRMAKRKVKRKIYMHQYYIEVLKPKRRKQNVNP